MSSSSLTAHSALKFGIIRTATPKEKKEIREQLLTNFFPSDSGNVHLMHGWDSVDQVLIHSPNPNIQDINQAIENRGILQQAIQNVKTLKQAVWEQNKKIIHQAIQEKKILDRIIQNRAILNQDQAHAIPDEETLKHALEEQEALINQALQEEEILKLMEEGTVRKAEKENSSHRFAVLTQFMNSLHRDNHWRKMQHLSPEFRTVEKHPIINTILPPENGFRRVFSSILFPENNACLTLFSTIKQSEQPESLPIHRPFSQRQQPTRYRDIPPVSGLHQQVWLA